MTRNKKGIFFFSLPLSPLFLPAMSVCLFVCVSVRPSVRLLLLFFQGREEREKGGGWFLLLGGWLVGIRSFIPPARNCSKIKQGKKKKGNAEEDEGKLKHAKYVLSDYRVRH